MEDQSVETQELIYLRFYVKSILANLDLECDETLNQCTKSHGMLVSRNISKWDFFFSFFHSTLLLRNVEIMELSWKERFS